MTKNVIAGLCSIFRYARAQKMTTPSRRARGRAMASPTSVEVNLVFLFTYVLFEKHDGSCSEKAHRVPQRNRFM